jgi:hypothetical protein
VPPAFPDRGLHDARGTAAQGSSYLAVGGPADEPVPPHNLTIKTAELARAAVSRSGRQ